MIEVDQQFADELAEVSRLLEGDNQQDRVLCRLAQLAVRVVPACDHAGIAIGGTVPAASVAVTDDRVARCHDVQFDDGDGPVIDTLIHQEPRRVDDARTERRWPRFSAVAIEQGLLSCLAVPVRIGGQPAGALALYGATSRGFVGASHDIALLYAAQGGTALSNAALYKASCDMIHNLHAALESRAVIEQAKGVLMARHSCTSETAWDLLRRQSQSSNTKLREVAARIVADVEP